MYMLKKQSSFDVSVQYVYNGHAGRGRFMEKAHYYLFLIENNQLSFAFMSPSVSFKQNMEVNKENVRRKLKTKIPLPLEPLPALPEHLFNKNVENCANEKRFPLKTLAQSNVPSSSKSKPVKEKFTTKPKRKVKIETKHVTVRRRADDLDWDYNVFKDRESVISISDDDDVDKNCKETTFFDANKQKSCLGERLAITPSEKSPLQHKSVKNIKRSLKRPHSRELQGLSPSCKLKKREEDKAKRRLQFNESLHERLQSPDYLKTLYTLCMNQDYTDHMLDYLLKVERKPLAVPTIPRITRACVINWLMKVNGPLGNPAVIQSACWYLDSILGTENVQLDRLQLVAAASFWIAQKLHGPMVPSAKLVRCSNYAFSQERLLAAEKTVLQKLGFPVQPVIPHEYITYLAWWCDSAHPGEIEVAATFLCMSGLMVEKELCEEYPSVIACASVRTALLLLKKKEMMKRLLSCSMYKSAEKKAISLLHICAVLRGAVRTVGDEIYEYKAPLDHYGVPPHFIAQRIIIAARQ